MRARSPLASANAGYAFCAELVAALRDLGVTQFCVCPGSRSAPLAACTATTPGVQVTTHVDERAAAFFALGWMRAGERAPARGWLARLRARLDALHTARAPQPLASVAPERVRPVALVCTSGTAAANFLPAVAEASRAHLPLLVLSADRPPELRARGAPQTIDQTHLYGSHVRWFHESEVPRAGDAELARARELAQTAHAFATRTPRGPVHWNLPFDEPLAPVPAQVGLHLVGARDEARGGKNAARDQDAAARDWAASVRAENDSARDAEGATRDGRVSARGGDTAARDEKSDERNEEDSSRNEATDERDEKEYARDEETGAHEEEFDARDEEADARASEAAAREREAAHRRVREASHGSARDEPSRRAAAVAGAPVRRLHARGPHVRDEPPPAPDLRAAPPLWRVHAFVAALQRASRPVFLAGEWDAALEDAAALLQLARVLRAPLLAEPLSQLRFGASAGAAQHPDALIAAGDALLRAPDFAQRMAPDLVLRIGAPAVGRATARWLAEHPQARVLAFDPERAARDPEGRVDEWLHVEPAALARAALATPELQARAALMDAPPARVQEAPPDGGRAPHDASTSRDTRAAHTEPASHSAPASHAASELHAARDARATRDDATSRDASEARDTPAAHDARAPHEASTSHDKLTSPTSSDSHDAHDDSAAHASNTDDAPHLVHSDARAHDTDTPRTTPHLVRSNFHTPPAPDAQWLPRWRAAEARAWAAIEAVIARDARAALAANALRGLVDSLPDGAVLFLSNSLPLRDAETFLPPRARRLRVLANRGANGIDGVLSSALGVAMGGAPVGLALGDLAFLHDAGALFSARRLALPLRVLVLNDGGGGIFDHLPLAAHGAAVRFEEVFRLAHAQSAALVAAGFGVPARRVSASASHKSIAKRFRCFGLRRAHLLEAPLDPRANLAFHRAVWESVARAVATPAHATADAEHAR